MDLVGTLNIATTEIVAVYIGERSRKEAQGLWQSLPALYRGAVCSTDLRQKLMRSFSQSLGIALLVKTAGKLP